jgi:hypothetical protein
MSGYPKGFPFLHPLRKSDPFLRRDRPFIWNPAFLPLIPALAAYNF